VFELAAKGQDVALGFLEVMFRSEASDDAIGRDDIHDIQTIDRGDGLRGGSVFVLEAARDVRVRGLETSETRRTEVVGVRLREATEDRQASSRLGFNLPASGPVETGVQCVSMCVVGEGLAGTGAHGASSKRDAAGTLLHYGLF